MCTVVKVCVRLCNLDLVWKVLRSKSSRVLKSMESVVSAFCLVKVELILKVFYVGDLPILHILNSLSKEDSVSQTK